MKKIIVALLAVLLTLTMTACSGTKTDDTPAPANKLEEIQQRGKLIVATSPDYAPMEFIDPTQSGDAQYVGSDIAFAKYIAEQLGVELQLLTMDFSAVLTSVDLGQADLAISGFGWKASREEAYELSHGYNQDGESSCQGLIVKADAVDSFVTIADFYGKKVVAQAGSLQEGYANDQIQDVQLQLVTDLSTALQMLKSDKVEAFACSCDLAKAYAEANDDLAKSTVEFDTSEQALHDGNVVAAKKGEVELINKVNEIIAEINASGIYQTWSDEAKALAASLGLEFED